MSVLDKDVVIEEVFFVRMMTIDELNKLMVGDFWVEVEHLSLSEELKIDGEQLSLIDRV